MTEPLTKEELYRIKYKLTVAQCAVDWTFIDAHPAIKEYAIDVRRLIQEVERLSERLDNE